MNNNTNQVDFRARLSPKDISRAESILGPRDSGNILNPLYQTNGVLFPYTPQITTGSVAKYDETEFIHNNYGYNSYVRSDVKPISISAEFTAQTYNEAIYLLSVIHFFRSTTKMYFGVSPYKKAGIPPPVLIFNYLGQFQFNNVPVVVKCFDFTYENNVDYIPVSTSGIKDATGKIPDLPYTSDQGYSYVPTYMRVNVELDVQYTPSAIRKEFNLDEFRSGKLVGKGYI
jgi:hypothetical protein